MPGISVVQYNFSLVLSILNQTSQIVDCGACRLDATGFFTNPVDVVSTREQLSIFFYIYAFVICLDLGLETMRLLFHSTTLASPMTLEV